MKINVAFAVLRQMKPEERTSESQEADRVSGKYCKSPYFGGNFIFSHDFASQ